MKIAKEKEKIQIHINNSRFWELNETFSLLLHFAALIFGILSISGALVNFNHSLELTMEILTLITITLILLNHLSKNIVKLIYLRVFFSRFWGEQRIENKFNMFNTTTIKNQYIKFETFNTNEKINIKFVRNGIFSKTLKVFYNVELKYFAENSTEIVNSEWVFKTIVINSKEKTLEADVQLKHNLDEKDIKLRDDTNGLFTKLNNGVNFKFSIDLNDKTAKWYSKEPFSQFGEWIWD